MGRVRQGLTQAPQPVELLCFGPLAGHMVQMTRVAVVVGVGVGNEGVVYF